MIRVVLAVCLVTALLAVALPGVDDARARASEGDLRAEGDRLRAAAASLVATEPGVDGPGARRIVRVRVPARSWWRARVDHATVAAGPDGSGTFRFRVAGEHTERMALDTAVTVTGEAGDRLVLRRPGVHRLVLTVTRDGGRTVVEIRRAS